MCSIGGRNRTAQFELTAWRTSALYGAYIGLHFGSKKTEFLDNPRKLFEPN